MKNSYVPKTNENLLGLDGDPLMIHLVIESQ